MYFKCILRRTTTDLRQDFFFNRNSEFFHCIERLVRYSKDNLNPKRMLIKAWQRTAALELHPACNATLATRHTKFAFRMLLNRGKGKTTVFLFFIPMIFFFILMSALVFKMAT